MTLTSIGPCRLLQLARYAYAMRTSATNNLVSNQPEVIRRSFDRRFSFASSDLRRRFYCNYTRWPQLTTPIPI